MGWIGIDIRERWLRKVVIRLNKNPMSSTVQEERIPNFPIQIFSDAWALNRSTNEKWQADCTERTVTMPVQ